MLLAAAIYNIITVTFSTCADAALTVRFGLITFDLANSRGGAFDQQKSPALPFALPILSLTCKFCIQCESWERFS
jgi:hypothetical protein